MLVTQNQGSLTEKLTNPAQGFYLCNLKILYYEL